MMVHLSSCPREGLRTEAYMYNVLDKCSVESFFAK